MKLPRLALLFVFVAMASSLWAADAKRTVVYISVGAENKLALLTLDGESGKLSEQGSLPLDGGPGCQAVSADGKHLYVGLRSVKGVAALDIDRQTGMLTLRSSTPLVNDPVYVATEPTGRYLLTTYYGGGVSAVFPIGEDGTVGKQATQIISAEKNPHSINLDPASGTVLVPNCGSDSIMQYKLDDKSGMLVPRSPEKVASGAGTGPRHCAFHPKLDVVYFINEKASSMSAFRFDRKQGTIEHLQTVSTLPAEFDGRNTCADIHVTPSGKYVYGSNRGHDSLAGFAIDQTTGKLTAIGQFSTEKTPRAFAIDPTGRYVIAAGQASGNLQTYRLDDATGNLESLAVYPVGKSPAWVTILEF